MDAWTILRNFWPLFILQFILIIAALLDLKKRSSLKHLSRGVWIAIIILFSFFGPILYFVIGRGDDA